MHGSRVKRDLIFAYLRRSYGLLHPYLTACRMTVTPTFPPLDGSIPVLPGFADFHAEHNPDLPWVVFPSPEDPTKTSSISFKQFAKATHRVAHAVRPNRLEGKDGDVVGVVIHSDSILYIAVLVGLVRAGFVVRARRLLEPPIVCPYRVALPHVAQEFSGGYLQYAREDVFASHHIPGFVGAFNRESAR